MKEGTDQKAIERIEAALTRIDRASERLASSSGPATSPGAPQGTVTRGKVERALSELDALIAELER